MTEAKWARAHGAIADMDTFDHARKVCSRYRDDFPAANFDVRQASSGKWYVAVDRPNWGTKP